MSTPASTLWQSRFEVPAAAVETFLVALDGEAMSVAAFEEPAPDGAPGERWRIELLHQTEPDRRALVARLAPLAERSGVGRIDLTVRPLRATDWLVLNAQHFPPQEVGRFWIHGSHIQAPPPADRVPIELDAGLAFGSGEHASTRGCLLALDRLARRRRFRRVLDLGCGSGILAIAAAKCWPARLVAADNDPVAVRVAAENAARNGVAGRVRHVVSEGYASPLIRASGAYDLILANILADPLCALARDLGRHLAPGGVAILAGLLDRQARAVIDAHRHAQLALRRQIALGPWVTLVLAKRRA